jgi:hypothetical protein
MCLLLLDRVNPKSVALQMGWSSVAFMLENYARFLPGWVDGGAMDRLPSQATPSPSKGIAGSIYRSVPFFSEELSKALEALSARLKACVDHSSATPYAKPVGPGQLHALGSSDAPIDLYVLFLMYVQGDLAANMYIRSTLRRPRWHRHG